MWCGERAVRNELQFWNCRAGPCAGQQQQSHDRTASGIAWDPWGDGNTAVRIGAGEFFQRERVSRYTLVDNAPFAITASYQRPLDGGSAALNPGPLPQEVWTRETSFPSRISGTSACSAVLLEIQRSNLGYVGNHAIHQTSSYDLNQIAPQNWFAASFMGSGDVQAAGFYAFNNYSSALTWFTHQGDATYHSLQALFKTRYKRSQLTAAYTWSHSIANVLLDDSSGNIGPESFLDPTNPKPGSWQFSDQSASHLHGKLQLLPARPQPYELSGSRCVGRMGVGFDYDGSHG